MAVISNNGVPTVRPLKPIFTKTQATFRDFKVDESANFQPGMVACMGENGVTLSTGEEAPLGLIATYRNYDVFEVPTVGVLAFGGGAMVEVQREVINASADWDAAKTTLASGTVVILESDESGMLTIGSGEGEAVCQLLEVKPATIVVGGLPSNAVGQDPEPVLETMTVTAPTFTDEEFAGKQLSTLTTGIQAQQEGTTVSFTGTINHITDWTDFSSHEEDRTGYYVPFKMEATDGAVLSRHTLGGEDKQLVFGQTGDGAGAIVIIWATSESAPTAQVTLYKNQSDADTETNGNNYTFDFSGCTFGEQV